MCGSCTSSVQFLYHLTVPDSLFPWLSLMTPFRIAGLSDAFLGTVIVYCILLLGIACSFYFVERVGRRAIVLGSGAFMAVIDAAIGGLGFKTMTPSLGAGLIALCSIWVFTYALSLAPIGKSSRYGILDLQAPVNTSQAGSPWSSCPHQGCVQRPLRSPPFCSLSTGFCS